MKMKRNLEMAKDRVTKLCKCNTSIYPRHQGYDGVISASAACYNRVFLLTVDGCELKGNSSTGTHTLPSESLFVMTKKNPRTMKKVF